MMPNKSNLKSYWFLLLINVLLLAAIIYVYLHPRPATIDLPIDPDDISSISVYWGASDFLYLFETSDKEIIQLLQDIQYTPVPVTEDYTAPGCASFDIVVHYHSVNTIFCIALAASGYGDLIQISTPELFAGYGTTAHYLGKWPSAYQFLRYCDSIDYPEELTAPFIESPIFQDWPQYS